MSFPLKGRVECTEPFPLDGKGWIGGVRTVTIQLLNFERPSCTCIDGACYDFFILSSADFQRRLLGATRESKAGSLSAVWAARVIVAVTDEVKPLSKTPRREPGGGLHSVGRLTAP